MTGQYSTGGKAKTEPVGRPVQGKGPAGEWFTRKLQSYEKCFYCKALLKKGQKVYIKQRPISDICSCLSHGDPADWDMKL